MYSVRRQSDGTSFDVKVKSKGGFADSESQDTFCDKTKCVFDRIYDQTSFQNHLGIAPAGGAHWQPDIPADAASDPLYVGGHKVYGLRMDPPSGYRNDTTTGIAVGDAAETMYAVFNGTHYNDKCCFDYGNAETNNLDDGAATMEALYFGNAKGGLNHGGAGKGPWIMADMENALWGGDVVESNEPLIDHPFVTAMIKGDESKYIPAQDSNYTLSVDHGGFDMEPCGFSGCDLTKTSTHLDCEALCRNTSGCVGYVFADSSCSVSNLPICWTKSSWSEGKTHACRNSRLLYDVPGHWAIKGGNAMEGDLTVYFDGKRAPGYAPMKKQGAIILGIGGDNSEGAVGTFYEGAMIRGYTSDATDNAIQSNIVNVRYGSSTTAVTAALS